MLPKLAREDLLRLRNLVTLGRTVKKAGLLAGRGCYHYLSVRGTIGPPMLGETISHYKITDKLGDGCRLQGRGWEISVSRQLADAHGRIAGVLA